MRRPRIPYLTLAATVLLGAAACGGSDPGGGTKTLYVQATAVSDGTNSGTLLAVSVRQGDANGTVIDNANVTMTAANGTQYDLPWVGLGKFGTYTKSNLPWSPAWHLQIVDGADQLQATLSAPGATVITSPSPGSTFDRSTGKPLTVAWRDDAGKGAMGVDLQVASYKHSVTGDPGHYDIDPGRLDAHDNAHLQVSRWTQVALAGGTAGSTFKATTSDQISFTIQ